MMAILVKERGVNAGDVFNVVAPRCVLGRRSDCDIQEVFDGNERVSRQHAAITSEQGRFFLEDLDSRNGTFLNGRRLVDRTPLAPGDKLEICGVGFRFHNEPPTLEGRLPRPNKQLYQTIVDDHAPLSGIMASVAIGSDRPSTSDSFAASPERKLEGLVKLLEGLGQSIQSDKLLENLLDSLFRVFPAAGRGFVAMRVGAGETPQITAARFRTKEFDETLRISRTITDHVLETQEAVLSSDVQADSNFSNSQSIAAAEIRSFMCAPLTDPQRHAIGIIQLDSISSARQFTPSDLDVLAAVVPQVSLTLNFSQLHEQALNRVALDRDMELARKVQLGLLPDQHPQLQGYDFHDFYEPAFLVGGDYFDYVPLKDGRLAVVLADVSGKGVAASLLMAKMSGELKLYLANEETPAAAVSQLNDSICASGVGGRFVTLVVAVINAETNQVTLVNAGHMAPLLRNSEREVREVGVEERCMSVGFFPQQEYKQFTFTMHPGDSLTLFTDGFTEAMNAEDDMYGDQRLIEQLRQPASDLAALVQNLLANLRKFVGDHPQSDDMCLVSFGCRVETAEWR